MISEKNQAVEDLQNVEAAFADVHRKYERTKQVVEVGTMPGTDRWKFMTFNHRASRRMKNS